MRVAVVVPRFGPGVLGGAERQGADLAWSLAAAGHEVELLAAGEPGNDATCGSAKVRLFAAASPDTRRPALDALVRAGVRLSPEEENAWLLGHGDAPDLEAYLREGDQDIVVALPYLAATTARAARAGRPTVLVPCLHDEPSARLGVVATMHAGAAGVLYNTAAEARLAGRVLGSHPRSAIGGLGFPSPREPPVELGERRCPTSSSVLVYAGRWELGKGVAEVVSYALRLESEGVPVPLVLMGKGPDAPRPRRNVRPLGSVTEEEKHRLLSGALALCQPSRNESFSIVLMEAWEHGTPVLVSSWCAVTREHVTRSGGGFHYAGYAGFRRGVDALRNDEGLRDRLGSAGRTYVAENYSWPLVLGRIVPFLEECAG